MLDNFHCHAGGYNRVLIKMILFFPQERTWEWWWCLPTEAESCLSFIFNNGQREQTWHVEGWEVECLPCYGVQQHLILPLYEKLGQISSATKVTASKSLSYRRLRLIDERIKMNQNTRESDTITITTVLCKLLKWEDYIYFECFLVGDYFT